MRMFSSGQDGLGTFKVIMPDRCEVCETNQDVVVVYSLASLKKTLEALKIDLKATIIGYKYGMHGVRAKKVGVTCGCYSKFHRQVAHIKGKMITKGKKRYEEEPRAKLSREG